MSTKKTVVLFSIILGVLVPLSLSAQTVHDQQGRETAAAGVRQTLSGVLRVDGTEWYLKTADATYLLQLGRMRTEAEAAFHNGQTVAVNGFVNKAQIAPVTMEADGKKVAFWDADGRPSWAGRGDGMGRRDGNRKLDGTGRNNGSGRGTGNGIRGAQDCLRNRT